MGKEKAVFAALALAAVLFLAWVAIGTAQKQPVAFFAYGANLAKGAMAVRAGGFINATAAELPGYTLEFASQDARPAMYGVANIAQVPGANASVSGALYYLTQEQLASLDRQAGAPGFYERREVAISADGKGMKAQAYFLSGSTHTASPSRLYLESAIEGAKQWGYGTADMERAALDAANGS
jgi:hypothetical protein